MEKNFNHTVIVLKEDEKHFLFPSTLFASREQCQIQTILGSCIAVCLYDEKMKWGGMNHYMLPWWNGKGVPSPKYGDVAIELLVNKLISLGSLKTNLIAKIFGGANQHALSKNENAIGSLNTRTAEELLSTHRIRTVGKSVGGIQGRTISFDTRTGQVFMKYIPQTQKQES
jgi:chemotaxis protein CheD